jgi:hypothetical protein
VIVKSEFTALNSDSVHGSVTDVRDSMALTARGGRRQPEGSSGNLDPHLTLRRPALFLNADVHVAAESRQEFTEPGDR